MPTRNFPGRYENVVDICDFVMGIAQLSGFTAKDKYKIQLSVDEACSNIIEHAYGGEGLGEIQCTCEVDEEALTIVLHDHGHPFDPSLVPEVEIKTCINDVKSGGAGLYLMRKLMDTVCFEFNQKDGNVLTMVKHRR